MRGILDQTIDIVQCAEYLYDSKNKLWQNKFSMTTTPTFNLVKCMIILSAHTKLGNLDSPRRIVNLFKNHLRANEFIKYANYERETSSPRLCTTNHTKSFPVVYPYGVRCRKTEQIGVRNGTLHGKSNDSTRDRF